ncbi:MAG TPA: hypothetical protein PKD54_06605, partial [Pirellulaceae bacterium]|nr:hypothetical protein [Pirellulaceae bacterium]
FRFNQHFGGLPVFRAGIGFLVRNEPGFPLVLTGFDVREFRDKMFVVPPELQPTVTQAMIDNVRALMDRSASERNEGKVRRMLGPQEIVIADEKLVIWAGIDHQPAPPEVAIVFMAERGNVLTFPDYEKELIVASLATGEILLSEPQIHHIDVTGNASGRATNGIRAAECDPVTTKGLPYAEASVVGGNLVFADANGNFVIPHGGSNPVTVRSRLRGRWFEVRDQSANGAVPSIELTINPPGPANFMHNPNSTEQFPRANVNAYVESNAVRDYVLLYEPTYPTIATQQFFLVNTNINNSCNAFYNGTSINFYRAGGGCNNTAFSDVVYHEYGHHLVNVTGNGQGQFGEGASDCIGVLMQDEPILGHGFQGNCNAGIRSANNTLQYPCSSGGVHFCGQLISGCIWDTRNALLQSQPANYRHIGAQLFIGMLIVRGQMVPGNQTIAPNIALIYVTLDDDDGDIGNGSPNYAAISAGFGAHNMAPPPLNPLAFAYPEGRPEIVSPQGGPAFRVVVSALASQPQAGSGVLHVNRGNGFETFPMSQLSNNEYLAVFPPSDCALPLTYYVSAKTTTNVTVTSPSDAPATAFTALSADVVATVFHDDFETDKGWTVSGDATDGHWERAIPSGGGARGDPPTDGDGSGRCYVTRDGPGNTDVDNGRTILTSPIINAAMGPNEEIVVSYYRWYSNHTGNNPGVDIFEVEVSNNGGATWSNLETVGPTGVGTQGGWFRKSFRLSDHMQPSSQTRIRFIASDLGPQAIVEAGVDGVEFLRVTCADPNFVPPTNIAILRGVYESGNISDVYTSDDQYLRYRTVGNNVSGFNQRMLGLVLTAVLPTDEPSALKFRFEGHAPVSNAQQAIDLFNYETNRYDTVDNRFVPSPEDGVTEIVVTGDILRFVQPGTGEVKARLTAAQRNVAAGSPQWVLSIDQIGWIYEE